MKTMKKALSIVLMMTVLVTAFAFMSTAVGAADVAVGRDVAANANLLGAYVYNNSTASIQPDPTDPAKNALYVYSKGAYASSDIGLADESGNEFTYAADTYYALSFEYYLKDDATMLSFSMMKGDGATPGGTKLDGGSVAGKAAVTIAETIGVSLDNKGDGKWHTAIIRFNSGALSDTQPHLYLRVAGGSGSPVNSVYLKNFRLVTTSNAAGQTSGWEKYFTDIVVDGDSGEITSYKVDNTITDADGNTVYNVSGWTSNRLGNTNTTDSHLVYNPDGTITATLHTSYAYSVGEMLSGGCISLAVPANGNDLLPFVLQNGVTYDISVKFKYAGTPDSNSIIALGAATDKNGNYISTASSYFMRTVAVAKYGTGGYTAADTWYTLTAENYTAPADTVLRVGLSGTQGLTIDEVTVTVKSQKNISNLKFNDNGTVTEKTMVAGTPLDEVGSNGIEGEQFLGWYTSPSFEDEAKVTTAPAKSGTLYAKYPTIVIDDFEMIDGYTKGTTLDNSVSTFTAADGKLTMTSANTGFILMAYDDAALTPAKFTDGTKYSVKVYYDSLTNTNNLTSTNFNILTAYDYSPFVNGVTKRWSIVNSSESITSPDGVAEFDFTFQTKTVVGGADAGKAAENLAFRLNTEGGANATGTFTAVIDKITITNMSLVEAQADKAMVAVSIREEKAAADNNGVYQSAGIRFKGRVSEAHRAEADELGFIAAPTKALGDMSIVDYAKTENNLSVSGKVKDEAAGMDEILYDEGTDFYGRKYYDYQLIITGLTREGVAENLLDTEITVVLYAVVDGVTTYTDAIAYSYNDVEALQ